MLTNSRDAFKSQSRSPNMVPFDMLGILFDFCSTFILLCYSNFVPKTPFLRYSTSENVVTLKSGSEVTQFHRNRYRSIRHPWLPINVTYLVRPVSDINSDFSRKSQKFPTRVYFAPQLNGFPLELCTGAGSQKLEWWGYRTEKEVWRYL